MTIPIWTGTSTFAPGQTPFGFYDTEASFVNDVDKVSRWCASRLGYPIVDVELQSGSFYAAFEEAITVYGNEVHQYKIKENYLSMEGNSTGSTMNNALITPSLGTVIRIAKNYGTEAGTGGNTTYYKGSLILTASVQEYDLNAWATDNNIVGGIELKRLFYEAAPAVVRYFDPYASTGNGSTQLLDSMGMGGMSPGTSFMLMPISFDALKMQAIEFNDQIRRSGYSFEIHNNKVRIFPIPNMDDVNLFFDYVKETERNNTISAEGAGGGLVTNMSQVPFVNPTYSFINAPGRQWIYQYTLAIAKEMLGLTRNKYKSIPIPGSEVTLNGDDLMSASATEKTALLEQLRLMLDEVSRKSQLERQSQESEFIKTQLTNVPMPIYIM